MNSTENYPGFFASMPSLTKIAFVCFILAKISGLGALVLTWVARPAAAALLVLAVAAIAASITLSLIEALRDKDSKDEYIRVKKRYELLKKKYGDDNESSTPSG